MFYHIMLIIKTKGLLWERRGMGSMLQTALSESTRPIRWSEIMLA
jgi:hypothetical protein